MAQAIEMLIGVVAGCAAGRAGWLLPNPTFARRFSLLVVCMLAMAVTLFILH